MTILGFGLVRRRGPRGNPDLFVISCSARLPLIPPAVLLLGRSPRKGLCKVSAILKRQFQDNPVFYTSRPLSGPFIVVL